MPYTFSDLRADLKTIDQCPMRSKYVVQSVLTKSLSGLDVPLVTVTAQGGAKNKKAVVLTA